MNRICSLPILLLLASLLPARAGLWTDDYEAAVQQAKAEGKALLLNFTGSDWCGWCIRLDKEVFSETAFKAYARDNLVCVTLDFPRRSSLGSGTRKQNEGLKEAHGIRGFPTILLLSPDEDVLERTGYKAGGAEAYIEHLDTLLKPHADKLVAAAPAASIGSPDGYRTWTSASGSTLEARFRQRVGSTIYLQRRDGREVKIGIDSLSSDDQAWLHAPPATP